MSARVRYGFKASQWDVDWSTLLATWELGDVSPEFDSGWLFDHFTGVRDRAATADGSHEAMTVAAALASRTSRLQFGHLVLGNTHRHPALVARMAATIDHVAGAGRFVLGLGAGWLENDHRMFGWPLPSLGERMRMLESSVHAIKGMWQHPEGFDFDGPPYSLHAARTVPGPITSEGPPIWLGTQGPRGLRLIAEAADGWNASGTLEAFREHRDALLRHCELIGRDPGEIEISAQLMCIDRHSSNVIDAAEQLAHDGASHLIFVILASDGPDGLRRLSRDVVQPLRAKLG